MYQIIAKTLTVLFLLQVFSGQAMAYSVNPLMIMSGNMHHEQQVMPSSPEHRIIKNTLMQAKTNLSQMDSGNGEDCCDMADNCSMEQCHFASSIPSSTDIKNASFATGRISLPLFSVQTQSQRSLLRPPILN